MINIYNKDCLEAMREMSDNQFDLAIVDPPYGIGESKKTVRTRKKHNNKIVHKDKDWDNTIPNKEYFEELKRVSSNQIIWGANYMVKYLTPSMGWIFWEKKIGGDFSDGELAYTSFKRALKMYTKWSGGNNKIHPTQKPVKLYEWLLMNYAKEGDKILDTHLGSGSIAIACHNLGYDLEGYELDKEYYDNALKRIKQHQAQTTLF